VRYVSTRGQAPDVGFADALLSGTAPDGGLYVPASWPALARLAPQDGYAATAARVMAPFVAGDLSPEELAADCEAAYATFDHPAVCPLVQLDANEWLLELFHGPTLAFKDIALQLLGRLFDRVVADRDQHVTVVVATSGDTGSAAIEAVVGLDHVDIVVLYPAGRLSDVQRRQMTTVTAPNVRTAAVEGTFDDCQDLVKALFADEGFRAKHHLAAMNSINWARVMAQVVYYVTAAVALGGGPGHRPVSFAVPTGNFGNVFAGWVARRMGLPVNQLVVGSNRNDILARFLHSGIMATSVVVPTLSPAMDIQVSSNVERLLFELNHRDGGLTAEQLLRFRATSSLALEADQFDALTTVFVGGRVDDTTTLEVIADTHRRTGTLVDPHTAVGLGAGRRARRRPGVPMVALATAHPAKFPDAVEAATGVRPPLPAHLADLLERPETTTTLANDLAEVQAFVDACGA
jgi:threonine synthase